MAEALYQPFPIRGPASAQIWQYAPEFRRPRHFHLEPELNLVVAGQGKFGTGASVFSVAKGDLLSWLPGQDHVLLEASPDFDLFVIGLTPALSDRVLGERHGSTQGGPARLRLDAERMAQFHALCAAPRFHDAAVTERHVGDFWREAHGLRASAHDKHVLTRRTLVSILGRPDLARAELARIARGDPSDVSRHFRRNVGTTLTSYRTRLRLLRFIHAADEGRRTLLSAALEAGFGSYSQCHRAFTKTLGCTPRVFFQSGARDAMRDAFDSLECEDRESLDLTGVVPFKSIGDSKVRKG